MTYFGTSNISDVLLHDLIKRINILENQSTTSNSSSYRTNHVDQLGLPSSVDYEIAEGNDIPQTLNDLRTMVLSIANNETTKIKDDNRLVENFISVSNDLQYLKDRVERIEKQLDENVRWAQIISEHSEELNKIKNKLRI